MICNRCHRPLTDPVSIQRQYGPVCAGKVTIAPPESPLPLFEKTAQDLASNPLFLACLGVLAALEACRDRDDMAGTAENRLQVK